MNFAKTVFAQIMISQTIETMLFEKIPIRELFDKPNLNLPSDDAQLGRFRDFQSERDSSELGILNCGARHILRYS